MIIQKNDGSPYASEKVADNQAKIKKLEAYKVIKVEGGYAIEVAEKPPEINEDKVITAPVDIIEKPAEKRIEAHELPENNVPVVDDYKEQVYPRAHFTGNFKKPKVTYIPEECKNPAFTYKFLLVESFNGGNMCDNWQVDKEVIRNMRRNPKYRHLVSIYDTVLKRGKYNELILCRMPMEYKEVWRKELRDRNNAALGRVTNKSNDIHSAGIGA